MKLIEPQEIEVFYILPAIRRELAINLDKEGLQQNEISELLHVTPAAINQYLNSKRALEVNFSPQIKKEIKKSALRIKNGSFFLEETQNLLRKIKQARVVCTLHKKFTNLPCCNACFKM